jgi:hypothetical protein
MPVSVSCSVLTGKNIQTTNMALFPVLYNYDSRFPDRYKLMWRAN